MNTNALKSILQRISDGKISLDEGIESIKSLEFEDIGFAKIDHSRNDRTGIPEVIFAPGKTTKQITDIFARMHKKGSAIIVSRADEATYKALKSKYKGIKHNRTARMISSSSSKAKKKSSGRIAVVTGGTSDIPVAEEAAYTAEVFGIEVDRVFDVGVAGIHRLLSHSENIRKASVVIVVAGMEGALASVVGGMVSAPVIAVPTSIGYGASFGGIAALLAMLNSCAPGVTVTNIDNGFGAAVAAVKILNSHGKK